MKLEKQFSFADECERKKIFLRYKDSLFEKAQRENPHNYKDGTLDTEIIENELARLINADFSEIEQFEYIQFERRKLNFKKDSLKEFLFVAAGELL